MVSCSNLHRVVEDVHVQGQVGHVDDGSGDVLDIKDGLCLDAAVSLRHTPAHDAPHVRSSVACRPWKGGAHVRRDKLADIIMRGVSSDRAGCGSACSPTLTDVDL